MGPRLAIVCLICIGFFGCRKEPESAFYIARPGVEPTIAFEIREVETTARPSLTQVEDPRSPGTFVYLHTQALFTNEDIAKTRTVTSGPGGDVPVVAVHFKKETAARWAEVTRRNSGKHVAILLDGEVFVVSKVVGEDSTGICSVGSGFKDDADAERVARGLVGQ